MHRESLFSLRSRRSIYFFSAFCVAFLLLLISSWTSGPIAVSKFRRPDETFTAAPAAAEQAHEHVDDIPDLHSPTESFAPAAPPSQATSAPIARPSRAFERPVNHPIDHLINEAEKAHYRQLDTRTKGVAAAAAAYRNRRGRHPPPKWDQYVKWCEEHGVLMIEEYFDQMYRDLAPFWAISAKVMRDFPKSWPKVISIRNGTTKRWAKEELNLANWMGYWEGGLRRLPVEDLPDVDLAFNVDDEPKLFVPWEVTHEAEVRGEAERRTRTVTSGRGVVNEFAKMDALPQHWLNSSEHDMWEWSTRLSSDEPLWIVGRESCAPGSEARTAPADQDYSTPAEPFFPNTLTNDHMYHGYVSNWTLAKSSCENPNLREMHGTWINMAPHSAEHPDLDHRTMIHSLVPLLAGCKISDINSEILIPPAMQWPADGDEGEFAYNFDPSMKVQWQDMQPKVMWRGSASGGLNTEHSWTRFHRHRFMAITNGTLVAEHYRYRASQQPLPAHVPGGEPALPHHIPLPEYEMYPLAHLEAADFAGAVETWMNNLSDTGFFHLRCENPLAWITFKNCTYTDPYYRVFPMLPVKEQVKSKYLPDLDGSSYSGRYRGILQSNNLPLKATIYQEWHDDRLQAWKHFVPMDNTNVDWYGILEYFAGYDPAAVEGAADAARFRPAHDDEAYMIARDGAEWAARAIRLEDQLAWMYRLVLELARLADDRRLDMGWVDDLTF